jgi:Domain of unknown function (DUF4397)
VAIFGSGWRDLIVCLCCALAVGCGGGSGGNDAITDTGFIRVVNTLPDAPTLNVGVTAASLARVSFAQSTKLTQLLAGRYSVNVQYFDASGATVSVIANEPVTLNADEEVSLFLVGNLDTPRVKVVANPLPAIAAGKAEYQVVHSATNQGTVDVYLTDAAAPLAGATPVTLAYEAASDLFTIDARPDSRLRVTAHGDATQVLYDSGTFAIESEARPKFVLVDYFGPGGSGLRAVTLTNIAATTFAGEDLPGAVRIANMVADRPAVDVYVDGVLAFPAVASGTVTDRQSYGAGVRPVRVTAAGNAATVLMTGSIDVNPGESRTLVVAGTGASVDARFSLDNTRRISVQAQVEVVQAAPAAGNVDLYLLASGETVATTSPDLANMPPLSVTTILPAVTVPYNVEVTPAGDKTVVAGPQAVEFDDNGIYSIYIADDPGGATPRKIVLGDDFN